MKRYYLALFVCALVPRLAVAQGKPTPVFAEKVIYSPAIPKSLWAFLPRGGASRFWGESHITYHGKKVWVHVYDVRETRFFHGSPAYYGEQDSGLDLFVFSTPHRLKQISSTRFTYERPSRYTQGVGFESVGVSESVGVRTLWLDPKSQKMPIVQVALHPNGYYGTGRENAICVFNNGVDKKAVVELRFGKGYGSNSALWVQWDSGFALMNNGLIGISYTQARIETRVTYYRWESNQFKAFRRMLLDRDEPDKSVEVPFDTP